MRETGTIAAVSTAMGTGGISIIRISGPDAIEIADRVFRSPGGKKKLSKVHTHTIHYGYICDNDEMLDEVLVSVMRGPGTFTAEDTVEINCHGGMYVTGRILDCVIKNGASPAEPGEFTKRAFLNGRIDLSQAEAVMDVISSENEYALKSSVDQLNGKLADEIRKLRDKILDQIAFIEAALDDPEHISLDGYTDQLSENLRPAENEIEEMIASFDNGRILSEGIKTVILGKPNAGKSSLLNVLTGRKRAIVTDIAGTTRDTLEVKIHLDGISLVLIDTAGIRNTDDPVEKLGVEMAQEAAQNADLLLYVIDSSKPLDEDDDRIIRLIKGRKSLILLNKSDLNTVTDSSRIERLGMNSPVIEISALEETGIKELGRVIKDMFCSGKISMNNQLMITNSRQKACLMDAARSIRLVQQGISDGMPDDMLTIDLMNAYESLGLIIGEEVEEDLVNRIFEKFCMGK